MANLIKLRRSAVQGAAPTTAQLDLGELAINTYDGKLFLKRDDGLQQYIVEVGGNVGFEVKNQTGSTITKGTVVKFAGTLGASGRILVAPFLANGTDPSEYVVGIVENDIPDGADGFAIDHGKIFNLNTSAFSQGTILYASSTVPGGLTATRPAAPNNKVTVAAVIHSSATAGILEVRLSLGSSLENDELVELGTLADGDTLVWNATSGRFENEQSGGGGTVTSVAASGGTTGLTFTGSPITTAGTLTLGGTLAVANGGTGVTTSTGTGSVVLSTSPSLTTPTLGAASATSIANGLGAVGTPSYTFTGDTNTGMWSPAADTVAVSTAGSERVRVNSAGNVGIGTTAPTATLDVRGTVYAESVIRADSGIDLAEGIGTYWRASLPSGAYQGGITYSGALRFFSGNVITERMRIDGSGNVGIGTTAPAGRLDVVSTSAGGASFMRVANGSGVVNSYAAISLDPGNNGFNIRDAQIRAINNGLNQISLAFLTANADLPAERMRIDSAGNVGIGTSSPAGRLHTQLSTSFGWGGGWNNGVAVFGGGTSGSGALAISYNDTGGAVIGAITPGVAWRNISFFSENIIFCTTGSTERMRIDSSGNVLVGATSGNGLADGSSVNAGIILQPDATVSVQRNNNANIFLSKASGYTDSSWVNFFATGTFRGNITFTGSGVAYNTSSDARLKHDIVDAPEASDLIDAIKVRSFKWNADDSEQRYGFVAQELVEVAPEAVSVPQDDDQMMGVDYSKLVPILVKEIQSLRARVAQLEGN